MLVLSGDGGLGKTALAEALAVSPEGFWCVDDPDDFRELDGNIEAGQAVVVDEVGLGASPVNEVKKLMDAEKQRRVRCRHFNGTIPKGRPGSSAQMRLQRTSFCSSPAHSPPHLRAC